jgi:hypothetical protein
MQYTNQKQRKTLYVNILDSLMVSDPSDDDMSLAILVSERRSLV